jgi:radical SAM protein with 4Fe4S-binding SPASM domain
MKTRKLVFSKYSTWEKAYNLILAKLQWRILKNSRVLTYPFALIICPGNICNLRCALCPTGQNDRGRKKGFLKFELFKKIMDECGPYLYNLSLYNWGEPLINKEIFKMVRYSKTFKINVAISTNLNNFNDKICSELLDSGVDDLIVSLDGASQESVSKYQIGNNFKKVIDNMKRLVDRKKELKLNAPKITWLFLVDSSNEGEIEQAKILSQQIGVDRINFSKIRCDTGNELLLNNEEQFLNVEEWLPENESLSMYNFSKKEKKKIRSCRWLWLQSSINWNGSVSPCCAVWHEKFDFGNVSDTSFFKIWNSPKYQEARKITRGEKIDTAENICNICHSNKAAI